MTLGTFAAILMMRVGGKPVEKISDLAGLCAPMAEASFLSMLMFSLTGIPPLGGFFGEILPAPPAVEAGLHPSRSSAC